MKNLLIICLIVSLWMVVGLACKNNPLAKFTKQYNCQIAGEPAPQTSEEYFKRAGKHMEENGYSAAFDECAFGAVSEGLKLDPQNAYGFAVRGFLYKDRAKEFVSKNESNAAKNDFESALEDLNEAIRLAPDNSLYYDTRSSIYEESGFLDPDSGKTLQDLSKAIELSPSERLTASLFVRRGDIYFNEKKDYENAVKDYTEAINLDPKNEELYSKRAQVYYKLGKEDLSTADDMKVFQLKDEKEGKDNPSNTTTNENSNNRKVPKIISGGILNGKATNLVKPPYPAAARAVRASGAVNVEVTVDEKGDVISARAISGHPLLRASAEQAARSSKFSPTLLSGQPVKVMGVIVYKFVP